MKTKRIIVIGAGESCCGIIRTIKNMGHQAVVIGGAENMPAQSIADYYLILEDNDVPGALSICKKFDIDAIVPTPVDRTLHWMGRVAEEMGYTFLSMKVIDNFKNKFKMKECFQKAGVLCAKGILTNKENVNFDLLNEFSFPLIMKPIDAYASRGVTKIESYQELKYYLDETSQFSSDGSVLIEEFIDGREFNAEGVCYQGNVDIYAIVEKIRDPFPRTIEMGHIIPPNITKKEENTIVNTIEKAVVSLGMVNGAFNAEIKLFNEKGYVIEVNGRLAGDFIISHLLKPTTGQDMEEEVVKIHLGIPPEKAKRDYKEHGMISFFNLPVGKTIQKVNDFSKLCNNPNVIWAHLFFQKGDTIPEVIHMGHRSGFVIVTANSRNEMFELAEKTKLEIINCVKFE